MRIAVVLLAVLALCVVGLLVTGLLEQTDPVEDEGAYESSPYEESIRETKKTDATAEPEDDTPSTDDAVEQPLVPRVLPADAAVEDVRDAIAATDGDAMRAAYERISRMSRKSAGFGKSIEKLARSESDKLVARIVVRAVDTPWVELEPEERDAFTRFDD